MSVAVFGCSCGRSYLVWPVEATELPRELAQYPLSKGAFEVVAELANRGILDLAEKLATICDHPLIDLRERGGRFTCPKCHTVHTVTED